MPLQPRPPTEQDKRKAIRAIQEPVTMQTMARDKADASTIEASNFTAALAKGSDPHPDAVAERALLSDPDYRQYAGTAGRGYPTATDRIKSYKDHNPVMAGYVKPALAGVGAGVTALTKGAYGAYKAATGQYIEPQTVTRLDNGIASNLAQGRATEAMPSITGAADLATRAIPGALGPVGMLSSVAGAYGETSADRQTQLRNDPSHPYTAEEARLESVAPSMAAAWTDLAFTASGAKLLKGAAPLLKGAAPLLKAALPAIETSVTDMAQAGIAMLPPSLQPSALKPRPPSKQAAHPLATVFK